MNHNVYAAYKGDKFIGEGTLAQLSESLGKKRKTLRNYICPGYMSATENTERFRLILLEEEKKELHSYVTIAFPTKLYKELKKNAKRQHMSAEGLVIECCSKIMTMADK